MTYHQSDQRLFLVCAKRKRRGIAIKQGRLEVGGGWLSYLGQALTENSNERGEQ